MTQKMDNGQRPVQVGSPAIHWYSLFGAPPLSQMGNLYNPYWYIINTAPIYPIHDIVTILCCIRDSNWGASQVAQWQRNCLPAQETWETGVRSLGQEDPLEEGIATHSSILAWRIPWTEEPGGLPSMGLQSQTWLKRLGTHSGWVIASYVLCSLR